DILADATVEDGKIKIRDEEFEVFILPPMTHMKPSTFEQVRRLVASGGSVIASPLLPQHFLDPGPSAPVSPHGEAKDVAGLFGHDPNTLRERFESGEAGDFVVHTAAGPDGTGNVIVFTGPGMQGEDGIISAAAFAGLKTALDHCITPDVTIS